MTTRGASRRTQAGLLSAAIGLASVVAGLGACGTDGRDVASTSTGHSEPIVIVPDSSTPDPQVEDSAPAVAPTTEQAGAQQGGAEQAGAQQGGAEQAEAPRGSTSPSINPLAAPSTPPGTTGLGIQPTTTSPSPTVADPASGDASLGSMQSAGGLAVSPDPLAPTTVLAGSPSGTRLQIPLRFESRTESVTSEMLAATALGVLNDPRGWTRAGFTFVEDPASWLSVVLADGAEVDAMCAPLDTGGTVSCQNGAVVALNAERWRAATDTWDASVDAYREYLVNHEVGHLVGQRHPTPRCPVLGGPAAVMEQQTGGLRGCVGNGWPREWEIARAAQRPVVLAPDPAWGPDPRPRNRETR